MLKPAAVRAMRAASGGFATSVWRVETAQRAFALRVFRAHERHVLERELLVLRSAAAAGLPVPRVHAAGSYEARPALLIDWCAGRPLLEAARGEPWRVVQLGYAFGRLQKRMHGVRAPNGLRSDWIDWPCECEAGLSERLRTVSRHHERLLHLDYHPLNVLAERGRLTAIVDWTNAHAGDPRADVARTLSILRLAAPRSVGVRLFELAWRSGYGPFGEHMAAFHAWAGEAMVTDLNGRVSARQLEPARLWAARWRRLA